MSLSRALSVADDVEDLLHDQRRQAERRLVEQQEPRPAISARAIASICCSPPDSVPPRWPMRCFEAREQREHALEIALEIARSAVTAAPICRFSSTVMRGKMRRPSGDCAMRSRAISCVGSAVMSLAVEDDAALARARIAEDRHHQRRLAGAVGADQGDDLALVDVEVDALERHDVAVEGLDAAHGRRERRGGHSPTSASTVSTSSSSTPR